jgi:hypothetical protein
MAALGVLNPTLLDLAKRQDPNGSIAQVVEMLNQTNEILDDMTWVEGNLQTGNKTTVRTGLPPVTWRKLYQGVLPGKSTTAQVVDNCGMMEAYAEVDKALVDLASDGASFRMSEEFPQVEAFNQELADTLFLGNEATEPEAFTGFAARYNALSGYPAAENVIDGGAAGGQTDCASIYVVVWSPHTVFGIIPKGSRAGLQITDKGQVTVDHVGGVTGAKMEAYRTHYRWDAGLCLKDWRYVVRIPNIDKSTLTKDAATGADLNDLLFQAINLIPNMNIGRPVIYMNRKLKTVLGQQSINLTKNSTLSTNMLGGRLVTTWHGIPIRRVDRLAADEARVA